MTSCNFRAIAKRELATILVMENYRVMLNIYSEVIHVH